MTDLAPIAAHLAHLEAGALHLQRCTACEAAIFPPRVLCPACGGTGTAWSPSPATGTVYSRTDIPQREGDDRVIVLVDLDEGVRVMGTGSAATPIGSRVRGTVVAGDPPTLRFEAEA